MVKDNGKRVNLDGDLHATKLVRKVMFINIIKNYHLMTELYECETYFPKRTKKPFVS